MHIDFFMCFIMFHLYNYHQVISSYLPFILVFDFTGTLNYQRGIKLLQGKAAELPGTELGVNRN